jgi:integrase/recombinase XerD
MTIIQVFPVEFCGELRIGVRNMLFDKSEAPKMRTIAGALWCPQNKCWHIPYKAELYKLLKQLFNAQTLQIIKILPIQIPCPTTKPHVANKQASTKNNATKAQLPISLSETQENALLQLEQCLRIKRYSYKTVKGYCHAFRAFLRYYPDLSPDNLSDSDIRQYVLHRIKVDKIALSTQNTIINAIKFYCENVLKQSRKILDDIRPKKAQSLPEVLSENEVRRLLNAIDNIKHRCILMTIYAGGLRLSEVINLRISDFNPERKTIFIRCAKGKKDRYIMLSEHLWAYLQRYIANYKPQYWVFEEDGGQYSARSVGKMADNIRQEVCNKYCAMG